MRFKSQTKYTWEGWKSSGNEAWVFNVEHPRELMGVHAKLIDNELRESEKIEYCLYSPRVHSASTPFGLKTEDVSSGLCLTDNRLIISQNQHIEGRVPVVTTIALGDIAYMRIGSSLLASWFAVHYLRKDHSMPQMCNTVIRFKTTGKHHFGKMIRSIKKYHAPVDTFKCGLMPVSVSRFIHTISNTIHRDKIKHLFSSQERCLLTFPSRRLWHKAKKKNLFSGKKQNCYTAGPATVLLTTKALLVAYDSPDISIGTSIEIVNIPLDRIASMLLSQEKANDFVIHALVVHFDTYVKSESLKIPFIAQEEDIADNFKAIVSFASK